MNEDLPHSPIEAYPLIGYTYVDKGVLVWVNATGSLSKSQ